MFYDLFFELCQEKGISPSKACLEMGLSRSLAAKWKNTKQNPSAEVLPKIAAYFDVSVDYLLGKDIKKRPTANSDGPTEDDLKFALFGGGDVTDAQFEEVKRFARFIKERDKGG